MKAKVPQRLKGKKLEYPRETKGSRIAADAREKTSQLSEHEAKAHNERAMGMIYGNREGEV